MELRRLNGLNLSLTFEWDDPNKKARLVMREDAERIRDAKRKWHETLREIEASATFKSLSVKLEQSLSVQRSAAAAHRLLVDAKLTYDSIGQYRRRGYKLSALHAAEALALFNQRDADLEALITSEKVYGELMRETPPAIRTGNPGLEC